MIPEDSGAVLGTWRCVCVQTPASVVPQAVLRSTHSRRLTPTVPCLPSLSSPGPSRVAEPGGGGVLCPCRMQTSRRAGAEIRNRMSENSTSTPQRGPRHELTGKVKFCCRFLIRAPPQWEANL